MTGKAFGFEQPGHDDGVGVALRSGKGNNPIGLRRIPAGHPIANGLRSILGQEPLSMSQAAPVVTGRHQESERGSQRTSIPPKPPVSCLKHRRVEHQGHSGDNRHGNPGIAMQQQEFLRIIASRGAIQA